MGKSFHRRSRHGSRPNKNQRRRERRRIRIRNRKVHDELKFTKFIKTKYPEILSKETFMTQISCPTTLDDVTSKIIFELGNLQKPLYSNKMVNSMTMIERITICIHIIEQAILTYDVTNDLHPVLRYLIACKKRFMRRGNLHVFGGHNEQSKTVSPKGHGRPPLHPNSTKTWSNRKGDDQCEIKDMDEKIDGLDSDGCAETDKAAPDQNIGNSGSVKQNDEREPDSPDEDDVPICIGMTIDVDNVNTDDVSDNQDASWPCSIM